MKKKNIFASLFVTFIMLMLVINPQVYIESAYKGLILFAVKVLPALFPFFFFSKLLCMFQADIVVGNIVKKPFSRLYNSPPSGGYIFFMSLLCGYPIGAKLISDYHSNNIINKNEAKTLSALASTSGPLFILGTVGGIILNNYIAGLIIMISHYLSAILNGVIFKSKIKSSSQKSFKPQKITLKDSINSSVISILIVGGYIVVFNIICDVFINIRLVDLLNKLCGPILGNFTEGIFLSFIEVTRGCVTIGMSNGIFAQKVAIMCGAVTFGGLSIIIQSYTFLEKCGIKVSLFLLMKIMQCVIAYFIALLLSIIIF